MKLILFLCGSLEHWAKDSLTLMAGLLPNSELNLSSYAIWLVGSSSSAQFHLGLFCACDNVNGTEQGLWTCDI
jgi:hypothetical protein